MIKSSMKVALATIAGLSLLSGCASQPVEGTEAVLVPVTTELKLEYKSRKASEKAKLEKKAKEFIIGQMVKDAESITVTAHTKQGQQLQSKLKKQLGTYAFQIKYQTKLNAFAGSDLAISSLQTHVLMAPCEPLGSFNDWTMQDGCFVDRARNKSLVNPSSLQPAVSELSLLEE